jgi:hypothetical protein
MNTVCVPPVTCLLDTTLEVGQCSAQHGHAGQALVADDIRELVAFLGELVGKVLLRFREDVDAERPCVEDGGLRLARLVQADQNHWRIEG